MSTSDELPSAFRGYFAERRATFEIERLPGAVLDDRYRLGPQIGAGGLGVVFRAFDERLKRDVAVKFLVGAAPARAPVLAEVDAALEEARAVAPLRHPFILTVHDVGRVEQLEGVDRAAHLRGQAYIVTEFVDGRPLPTDGAGTSRGEQLDLLADTAEAVAFAHDHGVIHRDLKPSNVLVDRQGRARVLDFGLARVVGQGGAGRDGGTRGYMAPEQWARVDDDTRVDLFALGVTAYEVIAGRRPFAAETSPEHQPAPPPLRNLASDVPSALEVEIHRCLAISPAARPDDAAALARLFRAQARRAPRRPARSSEQDLGHCPYPGLRAFTSDEARRFFGRDEDIALLQGWLDGDRPWIAIEGASGVGKSSFVHAGLLPRLEFGAAAVRVRLADGPGATLARVLAEDPPLVVIDQLEELVTHASDDGERAAAVASLAELLSRGDGPRLVTAARSDLLGRLGEIPGFARLLNARAHRFELGPLGPEAIRQAIEGPAEMTGHPLPEATVTRFMAEAASGASLPVLAHGLATLWNRTDGHCDVAAYDAMGGASGALVEAADGALAQLSETEREGARALLLGLVSVDATGTVTRRSLPREEADRLLGPEGGQVIARLSSSEGVGVALLSTRAEQGRAVLELVHERLATDWPTLCGWVAARARGLAARAELEAAAKVWSAAGEPPESLPRGRHRSYLEEAHEPSAAGQALLAAAAAAERRTEAASRRRKLRGAVALLGGAAVLGAAATWAITERSRARAEQEERARVERLVSTVAVRLGEEASGAPGSRDRRRALAELSARLLRGIADPSAGPEQTRAVLRQARLELQHGEPESASALALGVYEAANRRLGDAPADHDAIEALSGALDILVWGAPRPSRNLAYARDAVERLERAAADAPEDAWIRRRLVDQLENLGRMLRWHVSKAEAAQVFRSSRRIAEAEARRDPAWVPVLADQELQLFGLEHMLGRPAEALAHYEVGCRLAPVEGDGPRATRTRVWRLNGLGVVHMSTGRYAAAAAEFADAVRWARAGLEQTDALPLYRSDLVTMLTRHATASLAADRPAVAWISASEAFHRALQAEPRRTVDHRRAVVAAALALGEVLLRLDGPAAAAAVLTFADDAVSTFSSEEAIAYWGARTRAPSAVGRLHLALGRPAEAVAALERAEEAAMEVVTLDSSVLEAHAVWADVAAPLVEVYRTHGRASEARVLRARVEAVRAELARANPDNRRWRGALAARPESSSWHR